jgi:hypothetical protein
MARDLDDRDTLDLIPQQKKRGRPKTGNAMTNAERQRKFREEKAITITINREDLDTLKTLISNPNPEIKLDQEKLERISHALYGKLAREERKKK